MVFVDGYDIRKKTNLARRSMSFCPQQNILLNELTAREHIFLYSLIKGSSRKTANAEIKKYSQLLQFDNELNVLASNLSTSSKRKLSVTLALCGQSQVKYLEAVSLCNNESLFLFVKSLSFSTNQPIVWIQL